MCGHSARSAWGRATIAAIESSRAASWGRRNASAGVVGSWGEHPVIELIERGARVTISSDDPTYFECSLAGDLRQVASLTDLDVELGRQDLERFAADCGLKLDHMQSNSEGRMVDAIQQAAIDGVDVIDEAARMIK